MFKIILKETHSNHFFGYNSLGLYVKQSNNQAIAMMILNHRASLVSVSNGAPSTSRIVGLEVINLPVIIHQSEKWCKHKSIGPIHSWCSIVPTESCGGEYRQVVLTYLSCQVTGRNL